MRSLARFHGQLTNLQNLKQRAFRHRRRAAIEPLESRRLLASIFIDSGGVVHGVGTSGNDSLQVQTDADDVTVTVNTTVETFSHEQVTGVSLEGLGGNDVFRDFSDLFQDLSELDVSLFGGDGDDRFQGTT